MGQLKKYLQPYWLFMIATVFIKFLGAVVELQIPDLMEVMLDEKVPAGDLRSIYICGGLMVLCALGFLVFNIIANRMSAVSSGKITRAIRHDLFQKLERLSARQMDELTIPSAESRLTSDTYNINQLLARLQRVGIRAPILLIGGVAMMLKMDASLALILIALLPIIALVTYLVTKASLPLYTRQQSVLDRVVRTVQENITGIRVIKALSKTEYEKERFNTVNAELTAVDQKAGAVSAITNPTASLTLNLGLTLVVLVGAYRVNGGQMKPGVIVAFLQYFIMILNAMLGVTRIFVMWSKGEASAKRVAQVLMTPEDMSLLPREEAQANDAHIEFQNVSFSYTGIGKNVDDLSFRLERGQTLGILGPTGSGKSTILNLLMRIYDPDEGTIRISGRDIRAIAPEELRGKFGVVFQNDFVLEGSIAENIRFFRNIDDETIAAAAEHAQAEFVRTKEGGMDFQVQVRGNNLSGGQKQRLLIARALAGNPEILVLDDASSALDYRTDANLRHCLRTHYRHTTTVVVAQRISSLRHADLILVLRDGKVIGTGNHDQLMANCSEYSIIAQTQMGESGEVV
jgi:ATP-binding cassette subfamily B protein